MSTKAGAGIVKGNYQREINLRWSHIDLRMVPSGIECCRRGQCPNSGNASDYERHETNTKHDEGNRQRRFVKKRDQHNGEANAQPRCQGHQ